MDKLNFAIMMSMLPLIIGVTLIQLVARITDYLEVRFGKKKQVAYLPVHANLPARRPGA
jgi:hypothetical protein